MRFESLIPTERAWEKMVCEAKQLPEVTGEHLVLSLFAVQQLYLLPGVLPASQARYRDVLSIQ